MKKWALAIVLLASAGAASAEQTKTKFNPHTGRLDFITALTTTSVEAAAGIVVTTTSAGVSIAASGSAGSNLAVDIGDVEISSPTAAIDFSSHTFTGSASPSTEANIGLNASSVTLQSNTFNAANRLLQLDSSGLVPNELIDSSSLEGETHATEHENGGADEISVTGLSGLLADQQKVAISTGGTLVAVSSGVNIIAGTNITVTAVDSTATNGRVDVTINSTASGGGGGSSLSVEDGGSEVVATSTMNFTGDTFVVTDDGGEALVAVNFSSVASRADVILNRDTLQSGATYFVNQGFVQGQFFVGSTTTASGGGGQLIFDPATTGATPVLQLIQNTGGSPAGQIAFRTLTSTTALFGVDATGFFLYQATSASSGYAVKRLSFNGNSPIVYFGQNNEGFALDQASMSFIQDGTGLDPGFAWNVAGQLRLSTGSFMVAGSSLGANGINYNWPAAQASGTKILSNDGAGNLSWAADAGVSVYPATATVYFPFGQNASTATIWQGLRIPASSTQTVTTMGDVAIDTNAVSSSMGAIIAHDGTQQFYVVGTTNTPADNQIPKYDSSSGKIRWEADATAAGGTAAAGNTGEFQYNEEGVLGGSPALILSDGVTATKLNASTVAVSTTLRLPQGTVPKNTTIGDTFYDTSDGVLVIYDGTANRVFADDIHSFSVTVSTDGDGWDNDQIPLWDAPLDMAITIATITACTFSAAASTLTFNLEERAFGAFNSAGTDVFTVASATAHNTCAEYVAADFANAGIAARAHLVMDFDTAPETGTTQFITVTVYYRKDHE